MHMEEGGPILVQVSGHVRKPSLEYDIIRISMRVR